MSTIQHPRRRAHFLVALTALVVFATPLGARAATTAAFWHMDESSGKMIDSSSHGNDGTLSNVTRVSPGFGGGRAYSFNGSSSKVTVPNDSSLNPGSQNVTIQARVRFPDRPSAAIGDFDLVRKQGPAGSGTYKMEILSTGKAFCRFNGTTGGINITAGPDLSDNAWHTIICRKTSSSITLTVGSASFTKNVQIGSISSSIVLILGGKPNGGDWYKGIMDEVSIVFG